MRALRFGGCGSRADCPDNHRRKLAEETEPRGHCGRNEDKQGCTNRRGLSMPKGTGEYGARCPQRREPLRTAAPITALGWNAYSALRWRSNVVEQNALAADRISRSVEISRRRRGGSREIQRRRPPRLMLCSFMCHSRRGRLSRFTTSNRRRGREADALIEGVLTTSILARSVCYATGLPQVTPGIHRSGLYEQPVRGIVKRR